MYLTETMIKQGSVRSVRAELHTDLNVRHMAVHL